MGSGFCARLPGGSRALRAFGGVASFFVCIACVSPLGCDAGKTEDSAEGASRSERDGLFPTTAYVDANHVRVGDMILDARRARPRAAEDAAHRGQLSIRAASKRDYEYNDVVYEASLWPGGVLPIRFLADVTERQRGVFFAACRGWEAVANVRCVPWTEEALPLDVRIQDPVGSLCASVVGRLDAVEPQNGAASATSMNLDGGCWNLPIITHELGHAFGLMHEHSRPDRDRYLAFNPNHLDYCNLSDFVILAPAKLLTLYDLQSIMHYGVHLVPTPSDCFSLRPEFGAFEGTVGSGGGFGIPSSLDGQGLAALYGPPTQVTHRVELTLTSRDPKIAASVAPDNKITMKVVSGTQEREVASKYVVENVPDGAQVSLGYRGNVFPARWTGDCASIAGSPPYVEFVATSDLRCTLELDPAPPPPPDLPLSNLALRQPARQSSTALGATAERAVDGRTDGTADAGTATLTELESLPWWEVDLGAVAEIRSVGIWNRSDGERKCVVQFSETPFATTAVGMPGVVEVWVGEPQASEVTALNVRVRGRYVRIMSTDAARLSLAEVAVNGFFR